VPADEGSIAVLGREGGRLDALAGQMQTEIRWLPEPH
jgi:hypothetical protein